MTKRAAIYARTSTDEQAGPGKVSIPQQVEKAEAYASIHGLDVVAEYREDYTGTKPLAERPEGSKVMAAVKSGEVDVLIVWNLDRLARKATHALSAFEDIEGTGGDIVLVDQNIDTGTASGRFFRTTLAAMAEYESDAIVGRMGTARYAKAQRGEWPGGVIPYGYRRSDDGRSFGIEDEEADTVRRLFTLRAARMTLRDIGGILNAEGRRKRERMNRRANVSVVGDFKASDLRKLLDHDFYTGGDLTVSVRRDPHDPASVEAFSWPLPAILDRDLFDRASAPLVGHKLPDNVGKRRNLYGLSGRVYHRHEDGSLLSMYGSTRSSGLREYHCRAGRRDPETGTPASCEGFGVNPQGKRTVRAKADRIEAAVLGYALTLAADPSKLRTLRLDRDQAVSALGIDADRRAAEDRIAALSRSRAFFVRQQAKAVEVGVSDSELPFREDIEVIDASLEATHRILSDLATIEARVSHDRRTLAELLDLTDEAESGTLGELLTLPVEDMSDEEVRRILIEEVGEADYFSTPNPTIPRRETGPDRLTRGWLLLLRDEVEKATTPNRRGTTPALSPWAIRELRALAEALGLYVILDANTGEGPRLIDTTSGEEVTVAEGLPATFETESQKSPALWPNIELTFDPSLTPGEIGPRALLRTAVTNSRGSDRHRARRAPSRAGSES